MVCNRWHGVYQFTIYDWELGIRDWYCLLKTEHCPLSTIHYSLLIALKPLRCALATQAADVVDEMPRFFAGDAIFVGRHSCIFLALQNPEEEVTIGVGGGVAVGEIDRGGIQVERGRAVGAAF